MPRHVLARGFGELADAVARLDLHATRARELRGCPPRHDLPAHEDGHAVADQLHLAEEMGAEDDRDIAAAELAQEVTHDPATDRVQSAGGLVKHQQAR